MKGFWLRPHWVGGKELMPVANELLSQMFQHPNWTHRHAALLAVSAMAEGCLAEMYEMLDSIVAYVLFPALIVCDWARALTVI